MRRLRNQKISFIQIINIYKFLSIRRKIQIFCLLITSFMAAGAETISLASFYPFLSILSDVKIIKDIPVINNYLSYFEIQDENQLLFYITLLFCSAVVICAFLRLTNLWLSLRVSALIGNDIAKLAYKKTLYQDYQIHINRNTSNLISALTVEIERTTTSINAMIQGFTSLLIFFSLLTFIFIINWQISLITVFAIGSIYIAIALTVSNVLGRNSKKLVNFNFSIVKEIKEALSSIRDVIMEGTQKFYIKEFSKIDKKLKFTIATNDFLGVFPRFSIEALAMVTISLIAFSLAKDPINKLTLFPLLGALALGSQRLLPAVQQIYLNWLLIVTYENSVKTIIELLYQEINDKKLETTKKYNLAKEVVLENVCFAYKGVKNNALNNINLTIKKGEKLGIIGESGSGKSTLLDIIMGLLTPTKGKLYLDGFDLHARKNRNLLLEWRSGLSHVPQNIYLSDSNFEENIALGSSNLKTNQEKLKLAAKKAQLSSFIDSLDKKYKSEIGEDGIKLSGGQRQRIGIARAMYKNSNFLILDEATSALDTKTEKALMKNIDQLSEDITIILVSHRLSSLKNCDKIITIENGKIISLGIPEEYKN